MLSAPSRSARRQGAWPDRVPDENALDELLTRPEPETVRVLRQLTSPLVILGAGGKMGPTLAVLALRAARAAGRRTDVIAVSRFSDPQARRWIEARGVRTIAADLLERDQMRRLPAAENVIYLVGLKFGTGRNPAATWAMNTLAPAAAVDRYSAARLVALSTGNVYPMVRVVDGGADESHSLTPLGEYGNAAVARERILQFQAARYGTRMAVLRLNYALDLRYGVFRDVAQRVWQGAPIDLRNGYCNCIWQGDANNRILQALDLVDHPPAVYNLTHRSRISIRTLAEIFGRLLRRQPRFRNREAATALLSNPARLDAHLGQPRTPLDVVARWTARWVAEGQRSLERPTRFEVRDGRY
jgi:nucleoside-diphosphate-sugar epimerase